MFSRWDFFSRPFVAIIQVNIAPIDVGESYENDLSRDVGGFVPKLPLDSTRFVLQIPQIGFRPRSVLSFYYRCSGYQNLLGSHIQYVGE